MKRVLHWPYERAIRLRTRHYIPYATHIPVLAGLSVLCRPARIVEFGSGDFSTALFLDRAVFASATEIVSFENDSDWVSKVAAKLGGDPRLRLHSVGGDLAAVVAPESVRGDLIFIDDASHEICRAQTVRAVASACAEGVPVVIHDVNLWRLRLALRSFQHRFVFNALNPQTAVAWNGNAGFAREIRALDLILKQHSSSLAPTSGSVWYETIGRELTPRA